MLNYSSHWPKLTLELCEIAYQKISKFFFFWYYFKWQGLFYALDKWHSIIINSTFNNSVRWPLSLFSLGSSSVQEILLWGRPSLMSPLPAPDPTSQQWPNLVWKRATMGEPTGPLISRSPPPTHPTGQRGSSTHTEVHTDTRIDTHELSSCTKTIHDREHTLTD